MPADPTDTDDRLADLLSVCRAERAAGREPDYEQVCPDPALRERLRTLDEVERKLALPPWSELRDPPGYRLIGEIGVGGMGRVLSAFDQALEREVAVKVVREWPAGAAAAGRFRTEARVTARLPHPNIPPVYALGELEDGRPYLAMKRVYGENLDRLLKARPGPSADLPRFLRVFEGVCEAVGFAHANGVIHRDLKPGNVMVGAFGEVQVMDWGLAKVLTSPPREPGTTGSGAAEGPADPEATTDHRPPDTDHQTRAGLGTPAYLAPEQARGDAADARLDVFGLGGILCTILTGKPPFVGEHKGELVARSAAGDVADANDRLGRCGADAELVALARRCLSPEPGGRPADGRAVAEAVAAHRAGVEERARKAEADRAAADAKVAAERKRRRTLVWATAAVITVLATGAGVAAWQAVRASQAEGEKAGEVVKTQQALAKTQEAEEQARKDRDAAKAAEAVAVTQKGIAETQSKIAQEKAAAATASEYFLRSVLLQADPREQAAKQPAPRPDLSLREALDYASQEIAGKFRDQPEIEANLRDTIGRAFVRLGLYPEAEFHLTKSLRLREDHVRPPNELLTLETVNLPASAYQHAGKYTEAEPLFRRVADRRVQLLTTDHPDTLTSISNLAALCSLMDKFEEAGGLFEQLQAARRRNQDDYRYYIGVGNQANNLHHKGELGRAEVLYQEALKGLGRTRGEEHPETLLVAANLGQLYLIPLRRFEEAKRLFERALSGREKVLPSDHPDTISSVNDMALLHHYREEYTEAVRLYTRALEASRRTFPPGHPRILLGLHNLGAVYRARVSMQRPPSTSGRHWTG